MKKFLTLSSACVTTILLMQAQVPGQAISDGSAKASLEIKSCVVFSVKSPGKTYDCIREAKQAAESCKQMEHCEIPIGLNLTSGKDIDPGSGFLGKQVKIIYVCGGGPTQGGPYQQDDHASLVIDCSGMWW